VRIRNYKSICDATLDLAPFTVLIGQNGSGKSNVVDALAYLRDALIGEEDGTRNGRGGYARLIHAASASSSERIRIDVQSMRWDPEGSDSGVDTLAVVQGNPGPTAPDFTARGITWPGDRAPFSQFRDYAIYDLPSDAASHPGRNGVPVGKLAQDSSNLAAVLAEIKASNPIHWLYIREFVDRSIPGVTDLDVVTTSGYSILSYAPVSNPRIRMDAETLSRGSIRALAALAAAFQPFGLAEGTPVAIEEPEAGLLPDAAMTLAAYLSIASNYRQIIITTHSPDVLDLPGLNLEDVRITVMVDGETKIGRIAPLCLEWFREGKASPGQLFRDGELIVEGDGIPDHTSIVTR
jgi:predicted ATPase